MYQYVVDFVGQVPEQFEFVYTIMTLIISIVIFGTFMSIFYFVFNLMKGTR